MPAIPVHHTGTTDAEWDGPAAVAAMPNNADTLRYCHAWKDADGDPDDKSSYKDPHHKTKGGPANLAACRNGLARLANTDIPSSDDAGVKAHLQAHLNDGDPDRKQEKSAHSHGGPNMTGRTATMVGRTATIDELEAGTELDLEAADKRVTKCKMEIQNIINVSRRDGRPNLTTEEDQRVSELFLAIENAKADKEGIRAKLSQIKKLRAQDLEDGTRMREVKPSGAKLPAYDEVARVGREERTYHAGVDRKGALFLRDVIHQHLFACPGTCTKKKLNAPAPAVLFNARSAPVHLLALLFRNT
jgi:hypothetical protein